jgi:hypothetical protein
MGPDDGFFYDALKLGDGSAIRSRSLDGRPDPAAAGCLDPEKMVRRGQSLGKRFASFMESMQLTGEGLQRAVHHGRPDIRASSSASFRRCSWVSSSARCCPKTRSSRRTGLRALSRTAPRAAVQARARRPHGVGRLRAGRIDVGLFGGNSNWRGRSGCRTNYLVIVSLWNWDSFMGDDFRVEFPTGSGVESRLRAVAEDIANRLAVHLA